MFLSTLLAAQSNSKGKVSLFFDEAILQLPIRSISLDKQDGIRLSVKAEKSDQFVRSQVVNFEFSFKSFLVENNKVDIDITKTRLEIYSKDNTSQVEKKFMIFYDEDKPTNSYRFSRGGKPYTAGTGPLWEFNFEINSVVFDRGQISINGRFSALSKMSILENNVWKDVGKVEIKDGRFEIIL